MRSAEKVRLVVGWAAVVVLTAAVCTVVVTRVGQDVAGELIQPLPVTVASSPIASNSSTDTPRTAGTPGPSTPNTDRTSGAPQASGSSGPDQGPTADGTTSSFSAVGGVVTVRCREQQAQVRSVAPHDGYRFEIEVEGPTVHASFTNGTRDDEVEVTCQSGQPKRSGDPS